MANIIDGQQIASSLKQDIAQRARSLLQKPGLAMILVGPNPASKIYVESKQKACRDVGFESFVAQLPADTSQAKLKSQINQLNQKPEVDAILLQLPLPDHLDPVAAIKAISPDKDVDCLHPNNIGRLFVHKKLPPLDQILAPCTPKGVMKLLKHEQVALEGQQAVVVGRSRLVGKPMGLLLLAFDATVTFVHSQTTNLADICQQADILVAAAGCADLITADMVKPGATVIDVGINRINSQVTGDVDFASVQTVAGAITPVPGGVGPMTVASLLENTFLLAQDKGLKSF